MILQTYGLPEPFQIFSRERGGATSGDFPPHKGGVEEFIVVESGHLKAILDGEEYLLEEGDSVYFEADVTHRFDNVGDRECSYYLVIDSSNT